MKNKEIKIQVLGSGCPGCKRLHEMTQDAVNTLGINTQVEYITDIEKIVKMGVMSSPVLAINNKPVIAGAMPDLEEITEAIKKFI